jgi:hypothetical protein
MAGVSGFEKTKKVAIRGKCKWAHVTRLNRYDAWSVELWPIPEDLELLREWQALGMKNTLRKDDDGYYTRFRRDPKKDIRLRTGEVKTIIFAPPTVAMADGSPLPNGVSIGNGSDVSVLLEVYSHGTPGGGKAIAARLEGIRVDNLVPFNPDEDYDPEEKKKVDAVVNQPEALF